MSKVDVGELYDWYRETRGKKRWIVIVPVGPRTELHLGIGATPAQAWADLKPTGYFGGYPEDKQDALNEEYSEGNITGTVEYVWDPPKLMREVPR